MDFLDLPTPLSQRFLYHYNHRVQINHHIMIPKTQDVVAFQLQESGTFSIILFLFEVLTAVEFDVQFFS